MSHFRKLFFYLFLLVALSAASATAVVKLSDDKPLLPVAESGNIAADEAFSAAADPLIETNNIIGSDYHVSMTSGSNVGSTAVEGFTLLDEEESVADDSAAALDELFMQDDTFSVAASEEADDAMPMDVDELDVSEFSEPFVEAIDDATDLIFEEDAAELQDDAIEFSEADALPSDEGAFDEASELLADLLVAAGDEEDWVVFDSNEVVEEIAVNSLFDDEEVPDDNVVIADSLFDEEDSLDDESVVADSLFDEEETLADESAIADSLFDEEEVSTIDSELPVAYADEFEDAEEDWVVFDANEDSAEEIVMIEDADDFGADFFENEEETDADDEEDWVVFDSNEVVSDDNEEEAIADADAEDWVVFDSNEIMDADDVVLTDEEDDWVVFDSNELEADVDPLDMDALFSDDDVLFDDDEDDLFADDDSDDDANDSDVRFMTVGASREFDEDAAADEFVDDLADEDSFDDLFDGEDVLADLDDEEEAAADAADVVSALSADDDDEITFESNEIEAVSDAADVDSTDEAIPSEEGARFFDEVNPADELSDLSADLSRAEVDAESNLEDVDDDAADSDAVKVVYDSNDYNADAANGEFNAEREVAAADHAGHVGDAIAADRVASVAEHVAERFEEDDLDRVVDPIDEPLSSPACLPDDAPVLMADPTCQGRTVIRRAAVVASETESHYYRAEIAEQTTQQTMIPGMTPVDPVSAAAADLAPSASSVSAAPQVQNPVVLQDELWIVSAGVSGANCWRFDAGQWTKTTARDFYETDDPSRVTIFWAHGYQTDMDSASRSGFVLKSVIDRARAAKGENRSYRVVVWKWNSEREYARLRVDAKEKHDVAFYCGSELGKFVGRLNPKDDVVFIGFSFGAVVTGSALQNLATTSNGYMSGRRSADANVGTVSLILVSAACDLGSFTQGGPFMKGAAIPTRALHLYNPSDYALRFYPLVSGASDAMGVAPLSGAEFPNAAGATFNLNVNGVLGKEHSFIDAIQVVPADTLANLVF